ncbi:hypothetical protein EB810_13760 [Altererythrobacter sp. FM1]|nr:hypothetical protein EB810_13760 [Altererythrobacter sp. FM1]
MTFDQCIQISQAQLGQVFFMIDDAARLAHDLMAIAQSVLVQLLWVRNLRLLRGGGVAAFHTLERTCR